MSKRFYIGTILFCLAIMTMLVVWYMNTITQSGRVSISQKVLSPLKPQINEKIVKQSASQDIFVPNNSPRALSLLAVGDIMLDRSVFLKTQSAGDWNHPFLLIDPLFEQYDMRLANLEGPITTNKSVANGTGGARFSFTFSPNFVEPLKKRFEVLSLANNHTLNFRQDGLNQTRKYLTDANMIFFGDPDNRTGFIATTTEKNGIKLAFVGHHQLVETGFENVIEEIKKLDAQVDMVIVLPHWGTEYVTDRPTALQKKEAHEMIDAGADLILGAHPHVVQPIEIYKEKVIFYSLGNFIFDQYFSEETQTGLAVGMKIEKDEAVKIEYTLIPLDINNLSQPSVADAVKKEKVLSDLSKNSLVEEQMKEKIKSGGFMVQ